MNVLIASCALVPKDTNFRAEVVERMGLGFELLKVETVEVVPSSQEMEIVVKV